MEEILNDNGKDIKTLLRETFREYCEDYLQKKYL